METPSLFPSSWIQQSKKIISAVASAVASAVVSAVASAVASTVTSAVASAVGSADASAYLQLSFSNDSLQAVVSADVIALFDEFFKHIFLLILVVPWRRC